MIKKIPKRMLWNQQKNHRKRLPSLRVLLYGITHESGVLVLHRAAQSWFIHIMSSPNFYEELQHFKTNRCNGSGF